MCLSLGVFHVILYLCIKKMKVTELLEMGERILSVMERNNILRDDYKYLDAYTAYMNMRANRVKYSVAMGMLADEYHVSIRTMERIIKRLSQETK